MQAQEVKRPPSFGRRRGRKLPDFKQNLMDGLLPQIAIDLEKPPVHPHLWLEIGFGGGEHLLARALQHSDVLLVGCEPFLNGVARLLAEIHAHGLQNIRLFADDARKFLDVLPDAALEKVFIFFPDPWPKKRHHERRIVSLPVLQQLARVMQPGAELWLATDHTDYAKWMLEQVALSEDFVWCVASQADWKTPPSWWVATKYETKTRAQGRTPVYYRILRV